MMSPETALEIIKHPKDYEQMLEAYKYLTKENLLHLLPGVYQKIAMELVHERD